MRLFEMSSDYGALSFFQWRTAVRYKRRHHRPANHNVLPQTCRVMMLHRAACQSQGDHRQSHIPVIPTHWPVMSTLLSTYIQWSSETYIWASSGPLINPLNHRSLWKRNSPIRSSALNPAVRGGLLTIWLVLPPPQNFDFWLCYA